MTWLVLTLACGVEEPVEPGTPPPPPTTNPTSPDPTEPPEEPVDPSEWDYDGGGDDDGPIDLIALGDALSQGVVDVLQYDGRDVTDEYVRIYESSATPFCPVDYDDGFGNSYWIGYCGTPDGAYFEGYLFHYPYEDLESDGFILNGDLISGVVTLYDSQGARLDSEGEAQYLEGVSLDGITTYAVSYLNGGFYWDAATEGWLAAGRTAVSIALTGIKVRIIDARIVIVSGAITTEHDDELYALEFADASVSNAMAGSQCELEPGGVISVRDPGGRWVDVEFHGPILDVSEGDPARCDGCGDATYLGESIGEVCADFSAWFDWEGVR